MKKLFWIGFLFLYACGGERHSTAPSGVTEKSALHAVQSQRLRRLMAALNDLMYERMLTEVEIDRMRRSRTRDLAVAAGSMLETLDYIPEVLPDLGLEQRETADFLGLVDRLKKETALLRQEAEQNYVDAIPAQLDRIVETCNECHRLYRIPRDEEY
ncbi:MAG: hypothetical protein ACU826_10095 [Gammaproteobacteria bacterium]